MIRQTVPAPDSASNGVGVMLGLWLAGVIVASIGGWMLAGGSYYSAGMVVALLWPLGVFIAKGWLTLPPTDRTLAIVIFLLFSLLSAFASPVPVKSALYVFLTAMVIFIVIRFNSALSDETRMLGLRVFAVLGIAVLLIFAAYDYAPGVRLGQGTGILNPNAVAVMACGIAVAALAFRTWLSTVLILIPAAAVIIATGSRASAVATMLALAITLLTRKRLLGRRGKLAAIFVLFILIVVTASFWDGAEALLGRFFMWSDAHRGFKSGFSGRVTAWEETWTLFLNHPAIGVGFRAQEHVVESDSSSHNGYLGILAEIGLVGATAAFYMVLGGLLALRKEVRDEHRIFSQSLFLGLVYGYLLLALFERYFINVGNPLSILFLMAILRPTNRSRLKPKYRRRDRLGDVNTRERECQNKSKATFPSPLSHTNKTALKKL